MSGELWGTLRPHLTWRNAAIVTVLIVGAVGLQLAADWSSHWLLTHIKPSPAMQDIADRLAEQRHR